MRMVLCLLCAWLAACTAGSTQRPAPDAARLALTDVSVIDVRSGRTLAGQTVVISGDRIAFVGTTPPRRLLQGAVTVDAGGKYLIPGLWDAHIHLFRHNPRASNEATWFPLFIANGVTSVRDMFTNSEDLPILQDLRRQVAAGRVGPRIPLAGHLIDGANPVWVGSTVAATPEEGRAAVRRIKREGADFVKVYSRLSRETYFAIADEARKQDIPFAGHVPDGVRVAEASRAGQWSQEHLWNIERDCSRTDRTLEAWQAIRSRSAADYNRHVLGEYDPVKCEALLAELARNGTWMTVDLVLRAGSLEEPRWSQSPNLQYIPPGILEGWHRARPPGSRPQEVMARVRARETLKAAVVSGLSKSGARLLAGTDLGNAYLVPGFSVHENLELMVSEAGLTPIAALRAATINPAVFAGLEESLGTIEAGKLADLVLLDADPLADIRNTARISAVVAGGRYLDRPALDALLVQARRAALAGPAKRPQ